MNLPEQPVRHLTLRVDPVPDANYPSLTILIDGEDVLGEDDELQGFPAEAMLGPDSPLLPVPGGRRVGVYLCGCGIAGCGVSAPWIDQVGEQIVWSDFRNYVGVFEAPVVPAKEILGGNLRHAETFRFETLQYVAEVKRASADTGWRTPRRIAADLVTAGLKASPRSYGVSMSEMGGMSPSNVDDAFHLWLVHPGGRGPDPCLIAPPPGTADEQASWMLEYLRTTPKWKLQRLYGPVADDTED